MHTHMQNRTLALSHVTTHGCSITHSHTHTDTQTHTCLRTHTRTHTHTHSHSTGEDTPPHPSSIFSSHTLGHPRPVLRTQAAPTRFGHPQSFVPYGDITGDAAAAAASSATTAGVVGEVCYVCYVCYVCVCLCVSTRACELSFVSCEVCYACV